MGINILCIIYTFISDNSINIKVKKNKNKSLTGPSAQVLTQPLHLLKYHFFCNRVREIVNSITRPLRDGGVPLQIHFMSNLGSGKDLINEIWRKVGNDGVPLFIGMMIITIDHR